MDIEDDDDLYDPEEPTPAPTTNEPDANAQAATGPANASRKDEELEEGEEEDEGGEIMEEDDDDSVRLRPDKMRDPGARGLGRCPMKSSHSRDPRTSTSSWRAKRARRRLCHSKHPIHATRMRTKTP